MARNRRRRPFYEVIKDAHLKRGSDKQLQQLPSAGAESPTEAGSQPQAPAFVWPRRPRLVQINAGKVEISVPYQVAVAAVLGVVVLLLLAFRLGQWQARARQERVFPAETGWVAPKPDVPAPDMSGPTAERTTVERPGPRSRQIKMLEARGDNCIVIQEYGTRADLVPVQKYFARHGIETEIQQDGNVYFLVTWNLYENPEKKGTDGYEVKQRIIQLGRNYKAPPGRETFARHLFSDAYGKKVR